MKKSSLYIYYLPSLFLLLLTLLSSCQKGVYDELNTAGCLKAEGEETIVSLDLVVSAPHTGSLRMYQGGVLVTPDYSDDGRVDSWPKESEVDRLDVLLFRRKDNATTDDDENFTFVQAFRVPHVYTYNDPTTGKYEKKRYRAYFKIRDVKGVYKVFIQANAIQEIMNLGDPYPLGSGETLEDFKEYGFREYRMRDIFELTPGETLLLMSGESSSFDLSDESKLKLDKKINKHQKIYQLNSPQTPIELERIVARLDISYTNAEAFKDGELPSKSLSTNNARLRLKYMYLVNIRYDSFIWKGTKGLGVDDIPALLDDPEELFGHVHRLYTPVHSYAIYREPDTAGEEPSVHKNVSLQKGAPKQPYEFGGLFALKGSFYSGTYRKARVKEDFLHYPLSAPWVSDRGYDPNIAWRSRSTCLHVMLEDEIGQPYFYYIPIGEFYGKVEKDPISDSNPLYSTGLNRNTIYKLEVEQFGKDLRVMFFKFAVAKEKVVELPPITIYPNNERPDNSNSNSTP